MNTLDTLIQNALKEDCPQTDITVNCLLKKNNKTTAYLISKEPGIFYGQEIVNKTCQLLHSAIKVTWHIKDGTFITKSQKLCTLTGPAFELLKGERVMLNYIQRLSGIATTTHHYITTLNDPAIKLMDTRKTTPGIRALEKAAVKAGGGHNHRFSLSDMVLIKENHLSYFTQESSIKKLGPQLAHFKTNNPAIPIEIEIERLGQLNTYPFEHIDYILLDNFDIPTLKKALNIIKEKNITSQIEVSGNITLDTITHYKGLPIHRISVGAITHSVKSLDLSLLID